MKQEKFNKMIDKFYAEKLKDYCNNFLKQFNVDKKFVFTKVILQYLSEIEKKRKDTKFMKKCAIIFTYNFALF